jgi:valyl-tRNA synthetase
MNDDGTFNEAAQILIGEDRFEARKKIIPLLEKAGAIVKMRIIQTRLVIAKGQTP